VQSEAMNIIFSRRPVARLKSILHTYFYASIIPYSLKIEMNYL